METRLRRVRPVMAERRELPVDGDAPPPTQSVLDQQTADERAQRGARRRVLDRVFGDVLPDTTRDDRADRDRPDGSRDDDLLRDVPPHHA